MVAVPAHREIAELQRREVEIGHALAEAARVEPLLAEFEKRGTIQARILEGVLDQRLPRDEEPRSLMNDIYRAQRQSGIRIQFLRRARTMESAETNESGDDEPAPGSVWTLRTEGTYAQLTAMLAEFQSSERLYLIRSLDLGIGKKGAVRATLTFAIPWLPAGGSGRVISGENVR